MKKYIAIFALVISMCMMTGCFKTTEVQQMPGAWTSKALTPAGTYTVLNGGKHVTGSVTVTLVGDKSQNVISSSTMKAAVDNALAKCPGADAMIDIYTDVRTETTKPGSCPFAGFFVKSEYKYTVFVTGIPVKMKE